VQRLNEAALPLVDVDHQPFLHIRQCLQCAVLFLVAMRSMDTRAA
jgi:hypothetical protein